MPNASPGVSSVQLDPRRTWAEMRVRADSMRRRPAVWVLMLASWMIAAGGAFSVLQAPRGHLTLVFAVHQTSALAVGLSVALACVLLAHSDDVKWLEHLREVLGSSAPAGANHALATVLIVWRVTSVPIVVLALATVSRAGDVRDAVWLFALSASLQGVALVVAVIGALGGWLFRELAPERARLALFTLLAAPELIAQLGGDTPTALSGLRALATLVGSLESLT